MPTHLSLDQHLEALTSGGAALQEAAAAAGLDAKVPTCSGWDVTDLVVHQGMVHRWAAATLRGERDHDTAASQAEGRAAARLLDWYADGLAALVDTVRATPEDATPPGVEGASPGPVPRPSRARAIRSSFSASASS